MSERGKYKVAEPNKLSSWKKIACKEIYKWLMNEDYQKEVCDTTMKHEFMGPFTKFLYHFAYLCECGWGVMVDFDERKQRVFLPDHYYKWMHKLRDEIIELIPEEQEDERSVATKMPNEPEAGNKKIKT